MRSFDRVLRYWFLTLALAVFASGVLAGENPFDDLSSGSADTPEERYYGPEAYLTENRLGEYVAQSRSFLTRNPDSPQAAEVASDLLMAGTVLRDADTQQWARTRLLFDYPRSFAARYAVASFADEKSCRAFLQTLTRSLKDDPSEKNCRRLVQAIEVSLAAWGPTLVTEDAFVLECALVSYCVQHGPLHQLCRAQLARCSEETREIAAIAFESESTRETIEKLHALDESSSARLYEQFFYSRLTPEERQQPRMLRMAAEMHLRNGALEEALPLIEQALVLELDPQLLCWQGTCLAAVGRSGEACEALRAMQREFAESPWAERARRLARTIERQDESLAQHAEELFALLGRMRGEGLDQLEVRFELRSDEAPLGAYVNVAFSQSRLEAVLSRDSAVRLAYRTTDRDCRMYFDGESAIMEFAQAGALPVPSVRLVRSEGGGYKVDISGAANSDSAGQKMSRARDSLLDSPVLSSPESLAELLRYTLVRRGYFPEPVGSGDREVVLRWSAPAMAEPTLREWECRISRNESRMTFSAADGNLRLEIRHGPAGSFELSPPDWPDVPVARRETMDPTALFRLMAAIVQLFANGESH